MTPPDQPPGSSPKDRGNPRWLRKADAATDARSNAHGEDRRNTQRDAPWRKDRRERPAGGWKPRPHRTATVDMNDGIIRLYGLHPVEAALSNPQRRINRVTATDNAARKVETALTARGLTVEPTTPRDLDKLLGSDTVHQGIMIETDALPEPELEALAEAAIRQRLPLIVLDQVTDPHNVGAVLRSAAVFGATGVVITRRHSPPLNGTLAKAASGALELVDVALVQNLARALAELKEYGLRIVALDGDGGGLLDDEPFDSGVALVLGAEGRGLRQSTREGSDAVVRIATGGKIDSLNVSNAAAISLHLAAMRRRSAG